eukprot:gnl/TRDRNA2_/TRDRNA2_179274_c0_seq1.p1 gnl/TRDRNA2_/TRDRNA2_179274_c0~~gnl/TRDRNA2_/TRDRNA2_179274_c0_seq1.p1  ORF type:complete len:292 (+),score=56.46 gnl/TRDRNA2_/TRDRNA2_179274_c0_seq1:76-951(+)
MSCTTCLLIATMIVGTTAVNERNAALMTRGLDDESADEVSLLSVKLHDVKRHNEATAASSSPDAAGTRGHTSISEKHLQFLSHAEKAAFLMEANDQISRGVWTIGSLLGTAETSKFEDSVGNRKFVAAAQVHTKIGPLQVHPYDLAVYMDPSSPLWGKANTVDDLKKNSHLATIVFKTTQVVPSFIPLTAIKTVVRDMVMPYCQLEGTPPESLDALMALQFSGKHQGRPPLGSITTVQLDEQGGKVDIAGEAAGRFNSPSLTRAAISMCVAKDSPVPGLSDAMLSRLARGP